LSQLETECDLQDKITAAYQKLTCDTSVSKSIRRSRDQCYRKACSKVRNSRKVVKKTNVGISWVLFAFRTALLQEDLKRPPGHPRITWMKAVLNDLESHNLTLTEVVNMAQNRPLWRLLVQARNDDDDD